MPIISLQRNQRILFLLWACFILRGVFYSVLFPIWEGYDEYPHFAYVQYLASAKSLPLASTPVSKEIEQSLRVTPLPWMLRNLVIPHATHDDYWRLTEEDRKRRQDQLKGIPREWAGQPTSENLPNWEAQHPPLYYWIMSFPLRIFWDASLPSRVILLRLLGVVLASSLVPLGFLVARRVFSSAEQAAISVGLIAVMPELMVDLCRVGNESLALPLFALLMYAALLFGDNPGRLRATVVVAVSLGLGLLTKAYFLTALPAILLLYFCCFWSTTLPRRRLLLSGAIVCLMVTLISGWWYWRNHILTGSWSGVMFDVAPEKMPLTQVFRVDWKNALETIFLSHIWFGNWSFLQVRSWIYHGFEAAALLSVAGLGIIFLAVRKQGSSIAFLSSRRNFLILVVVYGFFWLGILYHVLLTFAAQGISASQGWYLYGVVVAEIPIVTAGLQALAPYRMRKWVSPAAIAAFGLLDLYTVHLYFIPYYSGLVAHKPNGVLATFHVEQLLEINLWALLERLATNRGFFSAPWILVLWVSYLSATFGLIYFAFRLARRTSEADRQYQA